MSLPTSSRFRYSPVLDAQRRLTGFRLSPAPRGPAPDDEAGAAFWSGLASVLDPQAGADGVAGGPSRTESSSAPEGTRPVVTFWLPGSMARLHALALESPPSPSVVWQVPSALLDDVEARDAIDRACRGGHLLAVSIDDATVPDATALAPFRDVYVSSAASSALEPAALRQLRSAGRRLFGSEVAGGSYDGVDAFARWPREPGDAQCGARPAPAASATPTAARGGKPKQPGAEYGRVLRALKMVHDEADPSRIEATLRSDPVLSFKLLRFANSAAFGPGQVERIEQAVVRVGYHKFARWLALCLVTSDVDRGDLAPLAIAAIARALMMEGLADTALPPELRKHAFLTGLFSLLPLITGTRLADIDEAIAMPPPTREALISGRGALAELLLVAADAEARDIPGGKEGAGGQETPLPVRLVTTAEPVSGPAAPACDAPGTSERALLRALLQVPAML